MKFICIYFSDPNQFKDSYLLCHLCSEKNDHDDFPFVLTKPRRVSRWHTKHCHCPGTAANLKAGWRGESTSKLFLCWNFFSRVKIRCTEDELNIFQNILKLLYPKSRELCFQTYQAFNYQWKHTQHSVSGVCLRETDQLLRRSGGLIVFTPIYWKTATEYICFNYLELHRKCVLL